MRPGKASCMGMHAGINCLISHCVQLFTMRLTGVIKLHPCGDFAECKLSIASTCPCTTIQKHRGLTS